MSKIIRSWKYCHYLARKKLGYKWFEECWEDTTYLAIGYFKEAYQRYLESDIWRLRSNIRKHFSKNKCENCNKVHDLQCHHISYKNLGKWTELNDLIVLCESCHKKVHENEDSDENFILFEEIENKREKERLERIRKKWQEKQKKKELKEKK